MTPGRRELQMIREPEDLPEPVAPFLVDQEARAG